MRYLFLIVLLSITPSIQEPELDWTPCRCNDNTLGLSENDFIKLQMYLSSKRDECVKGTSD